MSIELIYALQQHLYHTPSLLPKAFHQRCPVLPWIQGLDCQNQYHLQNIEYGWPLDFTGTGQQNTIHLAPFDNQFKYPMDKGLVPAIGSYESTYFSNKTVFVGFTVKEFAIFKKCESSKQTNKRKTDSKPSL